MNDSGKGYPGGGLIQSSIDDGGGSCEVSGEMWADLRAGKEPERRKGSRVVCPASVDFHVHGSDDACGVQEQLFRNDLFLTWILRGREYMQFSY